ncbi:MAG: O-antigen ligase family protein [Hyphomicrobium sp.]
MDAGLAPITIKSGTLAGVLVACALATSSIVFSEPAPADVLMMGVIVGVPVLGAAQFGRVAKLHLALWLVVVALGLAGTTMSAVMPVAIIHQVVTLYLVLGAFVLAGYVSADPEPRFRLIASFYVVGCLIACAAAFAGYFNLIPGTYDLFTNYGRARGTFKDPNVFAAALAPGLVLAVWMALRARLHWLPVAGGIAVILALGLLISFSRGGWFSAVVSIAVLTWISLVMSRRQSDVRRFLAVACIGTVAFIGAISAALQVDAVRNLMDQRATLDQSYDVGPDGRFGGQEKAKKLVLENPFGIGTHTFRETYHHEEPHNVYLSMFLNAGWIGGLVYIISVLATLFVGLRGAFQASALQGPFVIASAAFAGLVVEGLVIDSDHWRHFFIFMGLIWGLADAPPPALHASRRRTD